MQITKLIIASIKCLLWISLYVQHFTWIISFDLHNVSVRWILIVLFYRWRNKLEAVKKIVSHLGKGGNGNWAQPLFFWSPYSDPSDTELLYIQQLDLVGYVTSRVHLLQQQEVILLNIRGPMGKGLQFLYYHFEPLAMTEVLLAEVVPASSQSVRELRDMTLRDYVVPSESWFYHNGRGSILLLSLKYSKWTIGYNCVCISFQDKVWTQ